MPRKPKNLRASKSRSATAISIGDPSLPVATIDAVEVAVATRNGVRRSAPAQISKAVAMDMISGMGEFELDAFEAAQQAMIRHTPGILAAVAARRAELGA